MNTTKTGLVPQEDQAVLMINVSGAPGSTLEETSIAMEKVREILRGEEDIKTYSVISGYGLISGQGSSYGSVIVRFKDWEERLGDEHHANAVIARLNAQLAGIKEVQSFTVQPGMIPGYGMGNSIDMNLQDRTGGDKTVFFNNAMQFLGALNQREEVAMAYTTYAMNFPQVQVEVDAAQCKRAGVSPADVLSVLGSYCGGSYVSNFTIISSFSDVKSLISICFKCSPALIKPLEPSSLPSTVKRTSFIHAEFSFSRVK